MFLNSLIMRITKLKQSKMLNLPSSLYIIYEVITFTKLRKVHLYFVQLTSGNALALIIKKVIILRNSTIKQYNIPLF